MQHRIENIAPKRLVGIRLTMSLADNKTVELWRSFMPGRNEIENTVGTELYSLQVLPTDYFTNFNPTTAFEKWAAVEVEDTTTVPADMEAFDLPGGEYAVFLHTGGPAKGPQAFQYIMGTWLPNSGYQLDNRPHFELLGDKYKNNDPDSEEEIWIPVKDR